MKRKNAKNKSKSTSKKASAGRRGFAAMSKSKLKQIASMGGRASHSKMMSSGGQPASSESKNK